MSGCGGRVLLATGQKHEQKKLRETRAKQRSRKDNRKTVLNKGLSDPRVAQFDRGAFCVQVATAAAEAKRVAHGTKKDLPAAVTALRSRTHEATKKKKATPPQLSQFCTSLQPKKTTPSHLTPINIPKSSSNTFHPMAHQVSPHPLLSHICARLQASA